MISKKFLPALVAMLATAISGGAAAQGFSFSDQGLNLGTSIYQSTNSGSSWGTYTMGARNVSFNGSATFQAYCIDPKTGGTGSGYLAATPLESFFSTAGLTTSGYAQQIARTGYSGMGLSNSAAAQQTALNDIKELFDYAYSDSLTSATKAAAFGWAVWEVMTQNWGTTSGSGATLGGTGYSLASGTLRSKGGNSTSNDNPGDSVEQWMKNYLNALNGTVTWASLGTGTATRSEWTYTVYYDTTSPFSQNFISVTPGGTTSNVPVPATAVLVLVALAGVARLRKRAG